MQSNVLPLWHSRACGGALIAICASVISLSAHAEKGTGQVVVEISSTCQDGERFVRDDQSLWVYAQADGSAQPYWRLLDKVQRRGASETSSVAWTALPGKYWIDLVKSSGEAWPPLKRSRSSLPVTIVSGQTKRLRFPSEASCTGAWEFRGAGGPYAAGAAYVDRRDEYKALTNMVARKEKQCRDMAIPLRNVQAQIQVNPPRSGRIFVADWAPPGYDQTIYRREFDASQIRLLVRGLKYMCAQYQTEMFTPQDGEESRLVADAKRALKSSADDMDDLNEIADFLEKGKGR
jgi:hypothetical protein